MARSRKQSTKYPRKRKRAVRRRKRVSPTKKRKTTVKRRRRQQKGGLTEWDRRVLRKTHNFIYGKLVPFAEGFTKVMKNPRGI